LWVSCPLQKATLKVLTYREYLAYAEKYLMLAEDEIEKGKDATWLLIPSIILAWASIESFVNNILDDFGALPDGIFELHERAFLLEKKLKLVDHGDKIGQFALEGSEYRRIEDKIFFLVAKFSSPDLAIKKADTLWGKFQEFKAIRDNLVHPRRGISAPLSTGKIADYIDTAKSIIRLLSIHVWGTEIDF
jgi:hypothetical protein